MRDEESLQHVSNKRYRAFLLKAGFTTFAEVLSCPPGALVQRTRLSAVEIEQCLELLANHRMPSCSTVSALCQAPQELLKTGDQHLDALLGGGLRPGTITELVGEAYVGLPLRSTLFLKSRNIDQLGNLTSQSNSVCGFNSNYQKVVYQATQLSFLPNQPFLLLAYYNSLIILQHLKPSIEFT